MIIEIKAPSPGESISEVEIATWFVSDGDIVSKDQEIAEIESEKATLPLVAEESGQIKIIRQTGEAIPVGEILCSIDTSKADEQKQARDMTVRDEKVSPVPGTTVAQSAKGNESKVTQKEGESISDKGMAENKPLPADESGSPDASGLPDSLDKVKVTPVAKKMMEENDLSIEDVLKGLRKISSSDIKRIIQPGTPDAAISGLIVEGSRDETRARMSVLRRKLSERLVAVKNETAMLTTFNEADMSRIMALRKKYQEQFVKEHGIKLGFMSFFVKASAIALKLFPMVNSRIEGEEIITPGYCDIGIAVQAEKGLMVPILRNAETMNLAEVEKEIAALAQKARNNRITIEDMSGGTFTITNGGVFGSMMSTPILNPPQAAILGMHNIIDRPVAMSGQIVIRPMMYLALSYDHRVIDGKESVSFLVKVKEMLENPEIMLLGGGNPEHTLLDL